MPEQSGNKMLGQRFGFFLFRVSKSITMWFRFGPGSGKESINQVKLGCLGKFTLILTPFL